MYNRSAAPAVHGYGNPNGAYGPVTPFQDGEGYQPPATTKRTATVPTQNAPGSTPNNPGFYSENPVHGQNRSNGRNNAATAGSQNSATPPVDRGQPAAAQMAPPYGGQQRPPVQEPKANGYISSKICKINGKDKVVDFSSKLSAANVEDFANVHGCGGKGHAHNSTVAVTICDFSKGKGDKSVTASYNLDVEIMDLLYEAAMDARLGKLIASHTGMICAVAAALSELQRWEVFGQQTPVAPVSVGEMTATGQALGGAVGRNDPGAVSAAANATLSDLRRWVSAHKQAPVSAVPLRDLSKVRADLENALATQDKPLFEYSTEKNNPYAKGQDGFVPVSKLYICYTPFRKGGEPSRYPWFIQIENFRAPLNVKKNGATAHDASRAIERKSVSINVSADDFVFAMVAVRRYVELWEVNVAGPVVRKGVALLDSTKTVA